MKKLLIAFVICVASTYVGKAQTPPLNKQQTLDYIIKLWKANYDNEDSRMNSIELDGKVLAIKISNGKSYRNDLAKVTGLKISKYGDNPEYFFIGESDLKNSLIWGIKQESDANRLKKALEHLIELIKAEKSTDPFDN